MSPIRHEHLRAAEERRVDLGEGKPGKAPVVAISEALGICEPDLADFASQIGRIAWESGLIDSTPAAAEAYAQGVAHGVQAGVEAHRLSLEEAGS